MIADHLNIGKETVRRIVTQDLGKRNICARFVPHTLITEKNKNALFTVRIVSRRKYHRGHPVKGQWVFGGVERESGETFLVPVPDRTADTLMTIIRDWIKPSSTAISDSWAAYRNLGAQGYTLRTVNQSIQFLNPKTWGHTNTIEATWRSIVFLGQYNRGEEYEFHLEHYMFAARCKARGMPPYLQGGKKSPYTQTICTSDSI